MVVEISYDSESIRSRCRSAFAGLIWHLAVVHKLDYATSFDHIEVFDVLTDGPQGKYMTVTKYYDHIHLRSNQQTQLKRREIRKVLDHTFPWFPGTEVDGVEVGALLYRLLDHYPFPDDFYRPLLLPRIEVHKGCRIYLSMLSEFVLGVLEEGQDARLN